IFTFTPAGMVTGCLPIPDISRLLPHDAEPLAAQLLRAGLAVAHDALVGANNADFLPAQHGPDLARADVNPAAGLALPLDVADDALALGAVLQVPPQGQLGQAEVGHGLELVVAGLVDAVHADLVVEDEALVLQHLGDAGF